MSRQWSHARQLRHRITESERLLWKHLQRRQLHGHKFRRKYPLAGHILDFVCLSAGVVVELGVSNDPWRGPHHARRAETLQRLGFQLLRFDDHQIEQALDDILARISLSLLRRVQNRPASPPAASASPLDGIRTAIPLERPRAADLTPGAWL